MSEHRTTIEWKNDLTSRPRRRLRRQTDSEDIPYTSYSRDHLWLFEHGVTIPASANPADKGNPERVDPEQAFVAALSSCHMLTFLALAAQDKHNVLEYRDEAVGFLEKNEHGALAITRVELHPSITFAEGTAPDRKTIAALHDRAHHQCFIANSVRTEITVVR